MADTAASGPPRRRKAAAGADAPADAEYIRISSDPPDMPPRFRGNIEAIEPDKIAGWVFDAQAQGRASAVAVALEGQPIAYGETGLDRPDVDKLGTTRLFPGFLVDLRAEGVQEIAATVLTRALAKALASGAEEASVEPELRISAAPLDLADGRPAVALTPLFPLPVNFPARRPVAQWCAFFDLDIEPIRAEAARVATSSGLSPRPQESAADAPRFIAFYLPQFHAIKENDEWWGPGFTEWTGVSTLKKQFEKHQAPYQPADLGFYDILSRDTRRKQGELAKQYGIYGFCYYFYWFSGKRILERPLELMLREREPNLPFCFCWANEPWSRRWDGSEQDVLMAQNHETESDLAILDDLAPYFADDRYIRIDGKPLFIIYRMSLMPQARTFVSRLREEARARGLGELHICNVMSFGDTDPSKFGCDAAVEFPPHNTPALGANFAELGVPPTFTGQIYDYESLVELSLAERRPFPYFPGTMPRWDNTARKGAAGHVYAHSSPDLFEAWLRSAAKRSLEQHPETPLVFINSWNEWGEGAHLEPDRATGRRYLDAVRRVASADPRPAPSKKAQSDETATIAALTEENRLLSRRLAELSSLTAPESVTPGFPETLASLEHDANGAAHIDAVNIQEARKAYSAPRNRIVHMRGWHFSRTVAEDGGGFSYLVLTNAQTRKSYFAMILENGVREDVAAAHTLDLKRATGFDIRIDCAIMEPGTYSIRVIETRGGVASHLDTGARLTLM
ncbi:MAG: glycoside hydrolase family 99-like domain-containing protein [Pseudomonadota bacterium]